jgi:hypothetical protein
LIYLSEKKEKNGRGGFHSLEALSRPGRGGGGRGHPLPFLFVEFLSRIAFFDFVL